MQVTQDAMTLRQRIIQHKKSGKTIGLITTMGFLHQGHASLMSLARSECEIVVASIFVNPLQFDRKEDLTNYPHDLVHDTILCETHGVDILFVPQAKFVDHIYTQVNVSYLDVHLCGSKRPGHFQGVCTIVSKLFNLVQPDRVYFGKKDIQQLRIIQRMVKDLSYPITVVAGDTVRDQDGLALSSRNSRLTAAERQIATIVPRLLNYILHLIKQQHIVESSKLLELAYKFVATEKLLKVDYIEIVDNQTLQPVTLIKQSVVIAAAIFIGTTRLIDNIILELETTPCN